MKLRVSASRPGRATEGIFTMTVSSRTALTMGASKSDKRTAKCW
jgi:hypothetical protein